MDYHGKTYTSLQALWLSVESMSRTNEITVAGRLRRSLGDEQVRQLICAQIHPATLIARPARLKESSSDSAMAWRIQADPITDAFKRVCIF